MDSDLGEMVFAAEKLLKKRLRNEKGMRFYFFFYQGFTFVIIIYENFFLIRNK